MMWGYVRRVSERERAVTEVGDRIAHSDAAGASGGDAGARVDNENASFSESRINTACAQVSPEVSA